MYSFKTDADEIFEISLLAPHPTVHAVVLRKYDALKLAPVVAQIHNCVVVVVDASLAERQEVVAVFEAGGAEASDAVLADVKSDLEVFYVGASERVRIGRAESTPVGVRPFVRRVAPTTRVVLVPREGR